MHGIKLFYVSSIWDIPLYRERTFGVPNKLRCTVGTGKALLGYQKGKTSGSGQWKKTVR